MSQANQENYEYFLRLNVENYLDEWIAIVGGEVVAHGRNVKEVYEEAKKNYPGRRPLISKVPSKKAMIL